MKGADFVWDKEKLDSFIAKPDEVDARGKLGDRFD